MKPTTLPLRHLFAAMLVQLSACHALENPTEPLTRDTPRFSLSPSARERPFLGRITGRLVASPTADPTVLLSEARAFGSGTHLGSFQKVTSDVVDLSTLQIRGSFTMTVANGDQLTGTYSGMFAIGTRPGTFSWVLDAAITGGTGRFSLATGAFVFVAEEVNYVVVDGVVYGNYTETFDGSIKY